MQSESLLANVIVKHTFLEFQQEDNACQLKRNRSEPSLASVMLSLSDPVSPKFKETSEYPAAVTPTTCASENGDDDDTITVLSDDVCSTSGSVSSDDVKCIVKNTFIEFKPMDGENAGLRRVKSDSCLLDLAASFEAATPSPCTSECCDHDGELLASVHQDDLELVANSLEDEVKESWADSVPDEQNGLRKRRGGRVRSGRARQREACRRRMRTPSPEMRFDHC